MQLKEEARRRKKKELKWRGSAVYYVTLAARIKVKSLYKSPPGPSEETGTSSAGPSIAS